MQCTLVHKVQRAKEWELLRPGGGVRSPSVVFSSTVEQLMELWTETVRWKNTVQ